MSASESQTAEARMETSARKIGPTGNKIRIRLPLPLRKRWAEDMKKHAAKEVPEYADDTAEDTTFIDNELKTAKANSNSICKILSKDRACEDANFIDPDMNLTTTAGVQDNTESICPVREGSCEEGHTDIMSNVLPPESSKSSKKEICVGDTDDTPSMELPITRVQGEVEKNDSITKPCEAASDNILSKKVLCETNIKTSRKRVAEEAKIKNPSKKLKTSAGKCGEANEQSTSSALLEATKVYKEFLEKVKRTVYLDNLSCLATDAVISMALNQFGNVKNVSFLTNYTVPFDIPQSALVEMETEKDAESVVKILDEFPFMISGMPRPVRAKHATAEMFNDRPSKPGRKLEFRWVGPTDPDCHDVRKFKLMSKRHELENLALIKNELQEEALLTNHQQDNLDCNNRKLETVDSVIMNGWINRLTHIYNLRFDDMY